VIVAVAVFLGIGAYINGATTTVDCGRGAHV